MISQRNIHVKLLLSPQKWYESNIQISFSPTYENVLAIPVSSITEDNKVFIKTKRGYVERKIKTGLQNDTRAQVISGLSQNDEVVVESTLVPKKTQARFPFRFFIR
ncbi:MAG: Acr family acridine efflux pump AcrA [Candidatus Woesebacteria bacterium GW2011_GWA1_45_8]|uniref:Acr family acridine efflux pump AcrA n=1 Tax=Candidatus Woesebacteria bacterium GW2011_GWA1_45_8 TaxID=1618559 RepID=A0A0G1QU70_9BACT|nr:MAG: Acr family acridine efflux pump AcrA [Candidatus Woesebacteria bacterium GW2011_GWA1_45_8]